MTRKRKMGWALAAVLAVAACADVQPESEDPAGAAAAGADSLALPPPSAASVVEAMRGTSTEGLWPGFSASSIPVALFDGERTFLVGHPAPPEEFEEVPELQGAVAFPGRHPAVRGNMPTEIGGERVAAVLLDELPGVTAERAAAIVTHERFHVYQLGRHPEWTVDELARFQYPMTDVQQLFDRRLETLALARSIRASTSQQSECWLRTALILRAKRMGQLPAPVAAYERGMERQEGLARYVERRAAGIETPVDLAPEGYPPENVRGRAYMTGEALALMLDRYASGWKDVVENAEEPPALDSLLTVALLDRPETSCGFSAVERGEILARATDAISVTRSQRESVLRMFEGQTGWRVRIVAEGAPLWPQSFDPMSVTRVGSARLVHERMLRAGNALGSVDVFDRRALSTGYLDDPLGSGIREVLVTGLAERPAVTVEEGGAARITAPGVDASFSSARVTETDEEIVVRLR